MCLGWLAANRERILEEEEEKRKVENNRTTEQKNKRTNEQKTNRTTEQAKITAESFLNWRKKFGFGKKKLGQQKRFLVLTILLLFN